MKFKHTPIYRKGRAFLVKPIRVRDRVIARGTPGKVSVGVLCNSFPKSGTHLLLQVLRALPRTKYYGSFLASVPSIRFRRRSERQHLRCLNSMAPSEVMPAHLYHTSGVASSLAEAGGTHFFIYRDLRDVVVSEAFYLATMAKWHRLSWQFRRCSDMQSRLLLSIHGLEERYPNEYPDIAKRFAFYEEWLSEEACLAIKFEDLVGRNRERVIRRIGEYFQERRGERFDLDEFSRNAIAAISPEKSHTFRTGKKQGWREHFTPEVQAAFDQIAGSAMERLGYK